MIQEAVRRFFLGEHHAPRFLLAALLTTGAARVGLEGQQALGGGDALTFACVVVFWAFQEWWMHKYLLHAPFKWLGTDIHVVSSCNHATRNALPASSLSPPPLLTL